jgi:hypothetical protein
MNRDQALKLVGHYVQIEPPAEGPTGRPLRDDWRIVDLSDVAKLENTRTRVTVFIGLDGIYSYVPDPPRSTATETHGVLQLHVVVSIAADGVVSLTSLPPPPW